MAGGGFKLSKCLDAALEGEIEGFGTRSLGHFFEGRGEGRRRNRAVGKHLPRDQVGVQFDILGDAEKGGRIRGEDAVDHQVTQFVGEDSGQFIVGKPLEQAGGDVQRAILEAMGSRGVVVKDAHAEMEGRRNGGDAGEGGIGARGGQAGIGRRSGSEAAAVVFPGGPGRCWGRATFGTQYGQGAEEDRDEAQHAPPIASEIPRCNRQFGAENGDAGGNDCPSDGQWNRECPVAPRVLSLNKLKGCCRYLRYPSRRPALLPPTRGGRDHVHCISTEGAFVPILLDQQPLVLPSYLTAHSTLGDALKWVRTQLPPGHVVIRVERDGTLLEGTALTRVRKEALGGSTLVLSSAIQKDLALTMLGKLAALIEWLSPQHQQVAAELEQGATQHGLERLANIVSAWQQIQAAYGNLARMLDISLAELPVRELTGESVLNEFCRQLGEMQTALAQKDFVLLSDILQYEMDGAVSNWMALLESTLGIVEPVAA